MIHFADIPYGFEFGSATVTRQMCDEKKGWIIMNVKTPRADIQIYVTKTGKVRLFNHKTQKEYKEVTK